MSKKIKKACLALAMAGLVGVSVGASACGTSKHPNARITIEFNGEAYVIDYMLYRNMYPQTVQHFIELADAGFYNDTIIHDYKSYDWVGGAYSYDETETVGYSDSYSRSAMKDYLENHSKESEYYSLVTEGIKNNKFSASVYKASVYDKNGNETVDASEALPTLIGEFSSNNHKIEEGKELSATFGTIKMFYYKKDVDNHVVVRDSFGDIMPRDYKYNCATSLFSLQMSNSTSYDASSYATFGQLKNNSAKERLQDLIADISDYNSLLGSTSKWSTSISMLVDNLDDFAGKDIEASFTTTSAPLIIRSIKITKY